MVLFKSGATVGSYAWGFLFKEADSYFHGGSDGHGYDTAAVPSVKKRAKSLNHPYFAFASERGVRRNY